MKEYIRAIRTAFGTSARLAEFLGVAEVTVKMWCVGKREPRGPERRMLYVLGVLMVESPGLFDALSGKRAMPVLPVARVTPAPLKREGAWSDAYWRDRSLTPAEMSAGEVPSVEDEPAMLGRMSDATYTRYTESCNDYLRRTGRVMPS